MEKGVTLKRAKDKVEEENHSILFLYKSDRSRYGKLVELMENDMQQRKEPFPKSFFDACRILAR